MTDNIDTVVTGITNAKVLAVAERVVREFQLAAEKVAAHHSEPAKYPMPSGSTATEHLMASRFKALPEGTRKKAADRVVADLKNAPGRAKKLDDLAKVDLHSPTSVEVQVRKLPFPAKLKFPADELRKAPVAKAAVGTAEQGAAAAVPPLRKLELRLHQVKCLEETNELFKDEISLGGTAVDESGDADKISSFRVKSFHTGGVQTYAPPRRLVWFSLAEGPVKFPKSYFVTLVLAEVDGGGFADFVDRLLDKVRDRILAVFEDVINAKLGTLGGQIGELISKVVAIVATKIFDLLTGLWKDDIFKPFTVQTTLSSTTGRWLGGRSDSPERTVTFAGHGGKYQLVYDWRMFS
ncbi:hypothetical protein [Streptomyces sp. NBC_00564]|uniref:hypothetical protein n=1 Tax=Streptomyces sp. NBC_00564 TaxID=2903663 RepID=UPI002FCD7D46|nr:hypothetical protein OG256_46035 [Streptomyces sp. NBC_00564]